MTAVPNPIPSAVPATPARAASAASLRARFGGLGLVVGAVVLAGFALRVWCARGPLWLDEIWSIENLAPLTRFWQVFWGISHDNNHALNSLWLYFASPRTAEAALLRAPSIAMGTLTIAAMAHLAARHGRPAAVAAALLTAVSYFFVNYSVEARGYAGMALAILIAFDALERGLARPDSHARFVFAAACGIGLLWHLAMAPAIALFAVIHLGEERRKTGRWEAAAASTLRFMGPTFFAALPAFAFIVAGIAIVGRFTIGGLRGFDAAQALAAIAEALRDAFGIPDAAPGWLLVAAFAATILAALRLRLVLNERRFAYFVILLALPAAVFVLRPPNAHIARYYLVCALFLILLAAEAFGAMWRANAWARAGALVALAAILVGDVSLLIRFQAAKVDAWSAALTAISQSEQRVVASSFDERIGKFIAYYDRDHAPIELVARADWCVKRPQWFIAETAGVDELPQQLDLPAGACRARFSFVRRYETWGLSRVGWALFRAIPE